MITFFTIPKPFVGHTGIIQMNALKSWSAIKGSEVLVFGNEEGCSEAVEEIGGTHIPDIKTSEYGTPHLDDVFEKAEVLAKNKYLCYVNADIILYPDIVDAVQGIPFDKFLMTGQRWDVDVEILVDAKSIPFLTYIESHRTLQDFPGMDYFLYPKGTVSEFLPFIVGRRGWDNWFVYSIRKNNLPIIDATGSVIAVHQNHDYNHIPEKRGNRWESCPESDYNLSLVKNRIVYLWELDDATHIMIDGIPVRKPWTLRQTTQGLILKTPERFHKVINPLYRAGHIAKYGFLKVRGHWK